MSASPLRRFISARGRIGGPSKMIKRYHDFTDSIREERYCNFDKDIGYVSTSPTAKHHKGKSGYC
jgi:hypothetical protein